MSAGGKLRDPFATPVEARYFEDYATGLIGEYGPIDLDEAEIVAFASRFDPQSIHCDPKLAAEGPFGGLIASGWHTAALMMRLYVEHYLSHVASLASPGIDELRWLAPVRPGDALTLRVTIRAARRSRSKPDRGLVHTFIEVVNQHGAVVMSMLAMNLLACRDAVAPPA